MMFLYYLCHYYLVTTTFLADLTGFTVFTILNGTKNAYEIFGNSNINLVYTYGLVGLFPLPPPSKENRKKKI